jgi:hypothetical protein
MEIGTKVQLIRNVTSNATSFLIYQKGIIVDRECSTRIKITGTWYQVEFNKEKYARPYWCFETELKKV